MDGTRDFSNLSDAELTEVKARVDASLSPLDHERLVLELRRRRRSRAGARKPIVLKLIGGLLILGAIASLLATKGVLQFQSNQVLFPVFVVPAAIWAIAGVLLLKGKRLGVGLGAVALTFQVISFTAGSVSYSFRPIIGAQIAWIAGDVHLRFGVGPAAHLRLDPVTDAQFALDLLALVGLYVLLKSLWRKPRAA